jgi:hypothetical protein
MSRTAAAPAGMQLQRFQNGQRGMSLMNEERKRRNHHLVTLGLSGPVEKRLLITQEELLAHLTRRQRRTPTTL